MWMNLYYLCAAALNISFAAFFFISRAKAYPGMLTKSQRWGLSLLGMIFTLNALAISTEGLNIRANGKFHDLVSIVAIAIILVFPKPVVRWKALGGLLAILGIYGFLGIIVVIFTDNVDLRQVFWSAPTLFAFHLLPMYLLWKSRNEGSMQIRMVMTIVSWGFFFNVGINAFNNILANMSKGYYTYALFNITNNLFFILMIAMVAYMLWIRRGRWEAPERFNLVFLTLMFTVGGILQGMVAGGLTASEQGAFIFKWLGSSWVWMRPLLLAFGVLRYQLFGSALQVNRMLLWLGWFIIALFTVITIEVMLIGIPTDIMTGAGVAVIFVAAYPAFRLSRAIIRRLLPLTAGEAGTNMVQQRSAYLLSLHTVVDDGRIGDDFDASVLANLRRKLGISEREHELLMSSFPRKKLEFDAPRIQELFLILSDGRLVAHAGSLEEEKEIVAGMLTAIRGFARDGLKSGHKDIDTVKYGDYTLIMESEGKVLLAALVRGPETTAVRVRLRDCLAGILQTGGEVLRKWDGELEKVEPVKKLLAATLASP